MVGGHQAVLHGCTVEDGASDRHRRPRSRRRGGWSGERRWGPGAVVVVGDGSGGNGSPQEPELGISARVVRPLTERRPKDRRETSDRYARGKALKEHTRDAGRSRARSARGFRK